MDDTIQTLLSLGIIGMILGAIYLGIKTILIIINFILEIFLEISK